MPPDASGPAPATYRSAGVDIAAGEEAVERIRAAVAATARPEVLGSLGGFAGCFAFPPGYRHPVLVSSTDGVGTKSEVAAATGRYGTIGIDLVAMCADDLVCTGAEPLFMLDYVSVGVLEPGRMEQIVAGVAEGCRRAGCALLGGEMAEHGDTVPAGHVDLAGFAVGVVEQQEMLGAERVRAGDVLLGLPSPGLRSNGYSLARHVLLERARRPLDGPAWEGAGHSLADELLEPSVLYTPWVLAARAAVGAEGLHAVAHVTGGGIPGNLRRVLPAGLDARLERRLWPEPRLFGEIRELGAVAEEEMEAVFNLGIGMVLVVGPDAVEAVTAAVSSAGGAALEVGRIVEGGGTVELVRS